MKTLKLALIGGAVLGAAFASGAANASPTVDAWGNLSITNLFGTATLDNPPNLDADSSILLPQNLYVQSTNGITYDNVYHDITIPVGEGDAITLSTYDLSSSTGSLTVNTPNLTFTYTSEDSSYSSTANGVTLTLAFTGALTSDITSTVTTPTSSDFIITFAQSTYGNGNVSYTANLDVPETFTTPTVPEPVSLSLFGSGLIGLGVVRRRRRA